MSIFEENMSLLIEKLRKDQEIERLKNGLCPDCDEKLIRRPSSLFLGTINYSDPYCSKCGKSYNPMFYPQLDRDSIPIVRKLEFLDNLNTPYF